MKPRTSFNIDFNYALSENINLEVTASVQLQHSEPHYRISSFCLKHRPHSRELLPEIDIMALQNGEFLSWIHTDSRKETLLSMAVGKAIEERGEVEIANIKTSGWF